MSTRTIDLEVAKYMEAVRAELDDLAPDERDDLIDDLEQHLREVAAEEDGSLEERLGSPAAYAAELRASAGLPAAGESSKRPGLVHSMKQRVRGVPGVVRLIDFSQQFRPGWWIVRAFLFVEAVHVLYTYSSDGRFAIPSFGGTWATGLVAIVIVAIGSYSLGRAAATSVFARRVSLAFSIVVIALGLVAAGHGGGAAVTEEISPVGTVQSPPLMHTDGSPISNICAYSSDMKPLPGVLLFDQDGRPIDNLAETKTDQNTTGIANLYPRQQQVFDPETGATKAFACPVIPKAAAPAPPPVPAVKKAP